MPDTPATMAFYSSKERTDVEERVFKACKAAGFNISDRNLDGTDVVEVPVGPEAPIAGESIAAAKERSLLPEDTVLVSIERNGELRQPTGETVVEADDVVTLLPREGSEDEALSAFLGEDRAD